MKKYFDLKALNKWLGELIKNMKVVAPKEHRGNVIFDDIENADSWKADILLPKNPPKGVVFPPRREIGDDEVVPTVLWGVRPCDVQALEVLDGVFLNDPVDEVYKKRREALTTVVFACPDENPTCFCTSLGSHPADSKGADILAVLVEGGMVVEALTDKGKSLLEKNGKKPTDKQDKEAKNFVKKNADKTKKAKQLPEHLIDAFQSEVWEDVSEGCLSCGVCSFLCPTCHCFDICDEKRHKVIYWDCCAFPNFTHMTSGENPRENLKSRMRNRILHKFDYLVRTIERRGCVGCGRCIQYCPAGLDIVETATKVQEAMNQEVKK